MSKYLQDGTYVVIPDLQVPYHNKEGVNALRALIRDVKPDGLLCVGDEADLMEVGRWVKGTKSEYAGTYEEALIETHDLFVLFEQDLNGHDAGSRQIHIQRSNHTDRQGKYVSAYAPALEGTTWNAYERIMGYNNNAPLLSGRTQPIPNTVFHTEFFNFAKNWIMAHGDEGTTNRAPGGTALNLAKLTGFNVLCGHTHKLGIQHENTGALGVLRQRLIGVEAGNLMDIDKAGYLKHGYTNWQMGCAILEIVKGVVQPHIVFEQDKKLIWNSTEYKWSKK